MGPLIPSRLMASIIVRIMPWQAPQSPPAPRVRVTASRGMAPFSIAAWTSLLGNRQANADVHPPLRIMKAVFIFNAILCPGPPPRWFMPVVFRYFGAADLAVDSEGGSANSSVADLLREVVAPRRRFTSSSWASSQSTCSSSLTGILVSRCSLPVVAELTAGLDRLVEARDRPPPSTREVVLRASRSRTGRC